MTNAAANGHRISLEDVRAAEANVQFKKVEDRDYREQIGRALLRAFSLAGFSQKEVAGLIACDVAQIARWVAGTERPQMDRLFAVASLREPLVTALAQMAGAKVTTRIEFEQAA